MRKALLLLTCLLLAVSGQADNQQLLKELDATIEKRSQFIQSKEQDIDMLKYQLSMEKDNGVKLRILDDLYNQYHVFKFDSAMTYANKGLALAKSTDSHEYTSLFTIHLAEILAIGGLYMEAINLLDYVEPETISEKFLFKFHFTYFSVYSYWSDYCHDQTYAPRYRQMAKDALEQAMRHADPGDPYYQYYKGEEQVYVNPDSKHARAHYESIIKTEPEKSRVYAMSAFALAGNYKVNGDLDKYEEYLIKASLSDLKCCTMENMALQMLALHLFRKNDDNIERAERYIYFAMEDAKFFNNRLRILEISRVLPQIMTTYQNNIKQKNDRLSISVTFISVLLLGLLLAMIYIHIQNRKLSNRRKQLAESNQQLKQLNQQLADTNKQREGLASIYIDLCAKYIDKLGKYQTMVKRKIKAHQEQELLQSISSTRISEEDASTFLNRFDKAFLELYPTFVEEFNGLLQEDGRIQQKSPASLTTELRTFALIRLGVKNTSDIAGLLFLSTQTIYNCRSVVKNKAINKDTFDEDIQTLCAVIH